MNFPEKYKIWYLSMYEPLPVFAPNGKLMRSGHLARAFSRKNIKTLFMTTDFDHHTHEHIKLPDYIKRIDDNLSVYYIPSKGYKKDISILARNGFDFETSKKVMDITKDDYLKIINLL